MPYISIRPVGENYEFLEAHVKNRNAFFNQLLQLARTGQLPIRIDNTGKETIITLISKKEKDHLEVQKLITGINRQNQAIEESRARVRYIGLQSDYLEAFHKPMGLSAARMLKPTTRDLTVNQTLTCPKCNEHFRYSDGPTLSYQKEALADHYYQRHGPMPQEFVEELGRLIASVET